VNTRSEPDTITILKKRDGFRFRSAARAEAAKTWGRFRLYWGLAVLAWVAWLAFGPWTSGLRPGGLLTSPTFAALCSLATWVPAWLSADLLSLRFKGNPEPHREWPPIEFLARAVGRLGPFFLAQAIWLLVFAFRHLHHEFTLGAILAPQTTVRSAADLWSTVPAWTLPFFASGLYQASWAALASALFRRPRRWLLMRMLLVLGTALNVWAWALGSFIFGSVPWLYVGADANVWLGALFAALLMYWTGGSFLWGWGGPGHFASVCYLASLAFLAFTLPLLLLTWWIAARRRRRHPFTTDAAAG
jgi:hypothetical protein